MSAEFIGQLLRAETRLLPLWADAELTLSEPGSCHVRSQGSRCQVVKQDHCDGKRKAGLIIEDEVGRAPLELKLNGPGFGLQVLLKRNKRHAMRLAGGNHDETAVNFGHDRPRDCLTHILRAGQAQCEFRHLLRLGRQNDCARLVHFASDLKANAVKGMIS